MNYTLLADGREDQIAWTEDVVAFAELTGQISVVDDENRVAALADGPGSVAAKAPGFTLDGVSLDDLRGRKIALVFWASWSGSRYDLPKWRERHTELAEHGVTVITIACDRDAADARPWIAEAAPNHPALIDTEGVVAEKFNITGVPTVVWIGEDGRISGRLHPATRNDQRARAHARIAAWLARRGRPEAAHRHFDLAVRLSPDDALIDRGLTRMLGSDPFGDAYLAVAPL